MGFKIGFTAKPAAKTDTAVILVFKSKKLKPAATVLEKETKGFVKNALDNAGKFTGNLGETFSVTLPVNSAYKHIICLGMGDVDDLTLLKAEEAGGKLFVALEGSGTDKAVLITEDENVFKKAGADNIAAHIAIGAQLRSYKFSKYKTGKDTQKQTLKSLSLTNTKAKKIYDDLAANAEGVFFARDLVNEPPNTLTPIYFAETLKKELKPLGVEIEILDDKKIKKLGMGALWAVAQGSINLPRVVIMRWKGSAANAKKSPMALVGKGVTFDTGGISLKPGAGMEDMKMDMGGAAAVAGTMKSLALRKSKAHVVGIVGLVENMCSHMAYRPADIVTSLSGKTIEVLNTDAEGRLVLADILTYIQQKDKPSAIIDLATLTGAMMVALGHEYCGTFVTDDKLWKQMEGASANTGEKLWRMPLDEVWKKAMESDTADLQNLGKTGRYAGACTAAGFLQHFIEGDTPWAHMDIAGTAWRKSDQPTVPKFASGFGVRVLDRLIKDNYE